MRAISASASRGNVRMSRTRFLVNPELPAPMKAICLFLSMIRLETTRSFQFRLQWLLNQPRPSPVGLSVSSRPASITPATRLAKVRE